MNEKTNHSVRILIGEREIPAIHGNEALDYLSKEGIAAFAVMSGGDDLRHYCEYLKAHGYFGDAYADCLDRETEKERVRWAVKSSRKIVNDTSELRECMRASDNRLV